MVSLGSVGLQAITPDERNPAQTMKWALVIYWLGSTVETGLMHDTFDDCRGTQLLVMQRYVDDFNEWLQMASENPEGTNYPESIDEMMARMIPDSLCVPVFAP
ncbi:hypothetical protein [Candidatus Rariloculus sp.]|uniref:hypothetical protein n=1 Tax=Candidatus Rariloculus sp. TaxID=3101265 RepID=UPI003D142919